MPDLAFDSVTDVHTFRFDNFLPDDFIKIRLNSGTPGIEPGFGGLMFDLACNAVPNAQCGNSYCDVSLGENCETCPGDCGACVPGQRNDTATVSVWYLKEADINAAVGTQFSVDRNNKPGDRAYESMFFTNTSQTASFGAVEEAGCSDCNEVTCPAMNVAGGLTGPPRPPTPAL